MGGFSLCCFLFNWKLNNWITVVDPKYLRIHYFMTYLKLGEFLFNWRSGMSDEIPEKFI